MSDWNDLFCAYLDGELDQPQARALEDRLRQEPDLARAFQRYQRTIALLRKRGTRPAPENLLPAVERRIIRRQRLRLDAPPLVRFPVELLLAVLLLSGIVLAYFSLDPPPARPPTESSAPVLHVELTRELSMEDARELGLIFEGDTPRFRVFSLKSDFRVVESVLSALSVDTEMATPQEHDPHRVHVLILSPRNP